MARLKPAVRDSRRKFAPPATASAQPLVKAELLVRFHSLIAEATRVVHDLAGAMSNGASIGARIPDANGPVSDDRVEISQDELFRSLIEARMNELGINQAILAKRMGVTPPVVSRILRKPSGMRPGTKADLAKALECSLGDLFRLRPLSERDLIEAGL